MKRDMQNIYIIILTYLCYIGIVLTVIYGCKPKLNTVYMNAITEKIYFNSDTGIIECKYNLDKMVTCGDSKTIKEEKKEN